MTPSYEEINTAIQVIARAKHDGRPVVPLIGGGISAECGIPTTAALVRYFATLRSYIHQKIYLPPEWRKNISHPFAEHIEEYGKTLEYVKDFNWPDPCRLTQDLRGSRNCPGGLDQTISDELDQLARELHPERMNVLEQLEGEPEQTRPSWLWEAVGDWKDLLRHMTDSEPDYAEVLFTRFHRSRRPGLSHRFLAFLTNVLRIRLFLTTTIDSLLEEALTAEGFIHRVFTLHPGRPFPAPEMVRDSLAVLKLHGDASTLLADNPTNAQWGRDFLQRFKKAFPRDALLLVLGCSGRGRLIMDLIERGVLDLESGKGVSPDRIVWVHYTELPPRAVERLLARYPRLRGDKQSPAFHLAGVKQPGTFLRYLYTALTSRYPASTIPYSTHSEQPTLLRRELQSEAVNQNSDQKGKLCRFQDVPGKNPNFVLFDNLRGDNREMGPEPQVLAPSASERLVEWMNDQTSEGDLVPIWIDLEGHYTLPDVVGAIIDRCRLFDPLLAPSVLTLNEPEEEEEAKKTLAKAVDRITEAVRRGRYVLAFDGFEAFIWPQTAHHGTTTKIWATEWKATQSRLRRLTLFLTELKEKVGDAARIGVSVNLPQRRHDPGIDTHLGAFVATEIYGKLTEGCEKTALEDPSPNCEEPHTKLSDPWTGEEKQLKGILVPQKCYDEQDPLSGDKAALALLCLSCFRRTRTLVALRALLGPLLTGGANPKPEFGPFAEVDSLIERYCERGLLIPLEGGMFWMPRSIRDRVYSENSRYTDTERFRQMTATNQLGDALNSAKQLLLLALHHDRIARHYYFETFVMSKDPDEFFEYVYHRVSSIRYLTKLGLVFECDGVRAQVESGCIDMRDLIMPFLSTNSEWCDLSSEETPATIQTRNLRAEVHERRQREIASLRLAWSLSRTWLQAQVPAELLVSWCKWLIEDDLPRFVMGYYFPKGKQEEGLRDKCEHRDNDYVRKTIADLKDDLYDLWAQCYFERTDYKQSIEVRTKQLLEWVPDSETSELRSKVLGSDIKWDELAKQFPMKGHHLRFLLNIAECRIRLGHELSSMLQTLETKIDIKENRPEFLLCQRLLAEAQLMQARREHDAGKVPLECLNTTLQAVGKGLVELRPIIGAGAAPTRQPYFRYRSYFLLARGEAAWMKKEETAFKRAYQDFELARGYIKGSGDRTFRAEVDLHAAACALAHANWLLRPNNPDVLGTAIQRAAAKYDVANGYLRLAFDHLLNGRRNVLWWKEYASLFCDYKSQRNLLRLVQLTDGEQTNNDATRGEERIESAKEAARAFARTLRQGLQTLRIWLDVELVRPTDQKPLPQARLATEMLLTGICFGELVCNRLICNRLKDGSFQEELYEYWTWLLETMGLNDKLDTSLPSREQAFSSIRRLRTQKPPLELRDEIRREATERCAIK